MFLNGFSVVHITIENPEKKVSDLYDSALLGVSTNYLYSLYRSAGLGDTKAKEEVEQLIATLKQTVEERTSAKLRIKKFLPLSVSPLMVENYVEQIIQEGWKLDVLIVYHIDLLVPNSGNRKDMFQAGEEIVAQLKAIAERFELVVLLPTQVNREGNLKKHKKKNPYDDVISRSVISRSSAKIELVDFFATLNRTPDEIYTNKMRLYIDKNRDGISDLIIPCYFDTTNMSLASIETLEGMDDYREAPAILKSVAIIYYTAFQDKKRRHQVEDKLRQFSSFLPMFLQEKLKEEMVIGTDDSPCSGKYVSIYEFLSFVESNRDKIEPTLFTKNGLYAQLEFMDKKTGEVYSFCVDIVEVEQALTEYPKGSFEEKLLSAILKNAR
jgi:hypothetical protein